MYKSVFQPEHPRAFTNGCVYEHVLQAEKLLGRFLGEQEVVHYKDGDKNNNSLNNLIVFVDTAAHTAFHGCGCDEMKLIKLPNGSYDCKRIADVKSVCPKCGGEKYLSSNQCLECLRKERQSNIPEKEELIRVINMNKGNFSACSRVYGVTCNAVRKWCKKYGIPYHAKEYKNCPVVQW